MSEAEDRAGARGVALALGASMTAAIFVLAYRSSAGAGFVAAVLALAAVAQIGWLAVTGRARWSWSGREQRIALLVAVFTWIGNACVARAVGALGAGMTAVITQTEIVFVALVAWVALGERVSLRFCAGAALAGAGVAAMGAGGDTVWDPAGVGFALASALSFALVLVIARASARHIDVERVNASRLIYAAVVALAMPGAGAQMVALGAREWGAAAVAALAGPVVCRVLQWRAARWLPAARIKVLMLSSALFALTAEALLFGQVPSATELICAAAIVAGVAAAAKPA